MLAGFLLKGVGSMQQCFAILGGVVTLPPPSARSPCASAPSTRRASKLYQKALAERSSRGGRTGARGGGVSVGGGLVAGKSVATRTPRATVDALALGTTTDRMAGTSASMYLSEVLARAKHRTKKEIGRLVRLLDLSPTFRRASNRLAPRQRRWFRSADLARVRPVDVSGPRARSRRSASRLDGERCRKGERHRREGGDGGGSCRP